MGPEFFIRLGWPAKALWPNNRTDRRSATASRQAAKLEGFAEARRVRAAIPADAHLVIEFFPPTEGRRDLDNLLASIKAHLDGIAQAAGVDDAGWSFTLRKGPVVKNGAVVVHATQADKWKAIGDLAREMVKGQVA